ncbi:MAG TPA: glycosyltransferase family 2 protein [Anaeromyxobacteraceae bacterium]|nr:glycosyltransferase family 2 protein [Anaeromyxobacteraceae bacterium]
MITAPPPDESSGRRTAATPYVSIVIPCLNEAKTLGAVIEKSLAAFERFHLDGEVLVADNGSTDGSIEIAERLGARVVHVPQRGYGNALRHGMSQAAGRLVVMGDADDTYDFGEVDRFVKAYEAGAEFVMGTRLPPGTILPGANPWLNRNLGTPVLTFVLNRLFRTRINDVNCGMRAIDRDRFLELELRSDGMEFASEMLIKASVMNLKIAEVPVTLHPDRRGRPSHLRRWSDGWRHLEFMLLHAPDQLLFLPGMLFLLLGLAFALPVSLGPARLLGRTFDFHFLFLGGTLVLTGLQGVVGAMLVRDVAHDKVLRPNRLLSFAAERLTLGRGLALAVVLFALGFGADAWVLGSWVREGFGTLLEPRRSVIGLLLMSVGAEVGLFAFLHAALRRHA